MDTTQQTQDVQSVTTIAFAEYLALRETNTIIEYMDGAMIVTPPPLDPHQEASSNLHGFLFVLNTTLKGTLRHTPTGVRLSETLEGMVEPDIFWVSPANTQCKLGADLYWHGAPNLIIEILSDSTAYSDQKRKYTLYQQYSVREYWIVNPTVRLSTVYVLRDGLFARQDIYQPGDTFVSTVLNNTLVDVAQAFG